MNYKNIKKVLKIYNLKTINLRLQDSPICMDMYNIDINHHLDINQTINKNKYINSTIKKAVEEINKNLKNNILNNFIKKVEFYFINNLIIDNKTPNKLLEQIEIDQTRLVLELDTKKIIDYIDTNNIHVNNLVIDNDVNLLAKHLVDELFLNLDTPSLFNMQRQAIQDLGKGELGKYIIDFVRD